MIGSYLVESGLRDRVLGYGELVFVELHHAEYLAQIVSSMRYNVLELVAVFVLFCLTVNSVILIKRQLN